MAAFLDLLLDVEMSTLDSTHDWPDQSCLPGLDALKKHGDNLRGWKVLVDVDDAPRLVTVLTHIRNDRWMVYGRTLPVRCDHGFGGRRLIVHRSEMTLVAAP